MRVYVAVSQGKLMGVYAIRKDAEEKGWVEEFELAMKLCCCGAPMLARNIVLARNGRLWETEEWECTPCDARHPDWGEIRPFLSSKTD